MSQNLTANGTTNSMKQLLPDGVKAIGDDDLYLIPFEMLCVAEEEQSDTGEQKEYSWLNPRRLGKTENSSGNGFDNASMDKLYNDIKTEGLMSPLIGRWHHASDGRVQVQVLDGERRFQCLRKQVGKKETVWSRKERKWVTADIGHEHIVCRVVKGNEKEALKIAFMVSDSSVPWGEMALVQLIKRLREATCSDKEILEITKKSAFWLKEQDDLIQLDEVTFTAFLQGKINRALALKLSKLTDIDRRHYYLNACYEDAVNKHQEEVKAADVSYQKAEKREEVAEGALVEARIFGQEEKIVAATEELKAAQEVKVRKSRKKDQVATPQAKTTNLRAVIAEKTEENHDDVADPLRPGRIKKSIQQLEELVKANGRDADGNVVCDLLVLHTIKFFYDNHILGGKDDFIGLLKRFHKIKALMVNRTEENSIKAEIKNEIELDDEALEDLADEELEDLDYLNEEEDYEDNE